MLRKGSRVWVVACRHLAEPLLVGSGKVPLVLLSLGLSYTI